MNPCILEIHRRIVQIAPKNKEAASKMIQPLLKICSWNEPRNYPRATRLNSVTIKLALTDFK